MSLKDGKHGLGYGYLLTWVFRRFRIPFGRGVEGVVKQTISMITLVECKCLEGTIGYKSKVSKLLVEQSQLKHELETMAVTLANKDIDRLPDG
ncbi:hypothetical protein KY289_024030 [Solanum tuberosum]|nr:hypothetical protein KY289_024030 [Solanum tuberosum]